jgi:hypothetical protein
MPFKVVGCDLEISLEEFTSFKAAKQNLLVLLSIEEKLQILLENYAEFEATLLTQTVNKIVFPKFDWSEKVALIYLVNRRIVNLLTACRLYIDQTKHDVNSIYGADCDIGKEIRKEFSRQYESRLGYRTMETLRNYVQHRGLPVDSVEYLATAASAAKPSYVLNIVTPYLDTRQLQEDDRFKPAILAELIKIGDKHDLKPLIRDYVEGIGEVHASLRQKIADDVQKWEMILRALLDRVRNLDPDASTVQILQLDERGSLQGEVLVFEALLTRRAWLERRAPVLTHFSRHVATNQPREQTKPSLAKPHD